MRYVMLNAIYTHADLSVCGYHLMGAETKKKQQHFHPIEGGNSGRESARGASKERFAFVCVLIKKSSKRQKYIHRRSSSYTRICWSYRQDRVKQTNTQTLHFNFLYIVFNKPKVKLYLCVHEHVCICV